MLLPRLCAAALLALLASPASAQIYPSGGYPDFARPGYGYVRRRRRLRPAPISAAASSNIW